MKDTAQSDRRILGKLFLALALSLGALVSPWLILASLPQLLVSCATTHSGKNLEALSTEDFNSISLRVELVTRVLAARVVEGKPAAAKQVLQVADVVDSVLADHSIIVIGSGLVSGKLKAQGWKDDEVMLGLLLVEDLIRKLGGIGEVGLPLGPHGRSLLATLSNALREAVAAPVSESDKQAAAKVIEKEKVRP